MVNIQFLNDPESVQWLKDTHLKEIPRYDEINFDFKSFMIKGNEDSPDMIELYMEEEPKWETLPVFSIHYQR